MKVESLPFYIYGILLFFIQFGNIHLRANASDLTDVQQSFEAFVKQFGRLYLSEKERELRFQIFQENYEKITKRENINKTIYSKVSSTHTINNRGKKKSFERKKKRKKKQKK